MADSDRPQTCGICAQKLRFDRDDGHHLEVSPVDPALCLGCWMAAIKIEMFLLQATSMEGRSPWDLEIQDLLKELLINFKEGKYAPAKPASAVTP